MKHALVAILLMVSSTATLVASSAQGPGREAKIPIFVGPQARDGFVDIDAGIRDSIKDIQNEFRNSREFVIAPREDEAVIVLVVVGRRRISGTAGAVGVTTGGTTFGGGTIAGVPQPTYTSPGVTTLVPFDGCAIDTVLRVGSYEKAITSEDEESGVWRVAAWQVVKDVTAWVAANRSALAKRPAAPSPATEATSKTPDTLPAPKTKVSLQQKSIRAFPSENGSAPVYQVVDQWVFHSDDTDSDSSLICVGNGEHCITLQKLKEQVNRPANDPLGILR